MAWKRLERLTRSADSPVADEADASGTSDSTAPAGKRKKAKKPSREQQSGERPTDGASTSGGQRELEPASGAGTLNGRADGPRSGGSKNRPKGKPKAKKRADAGAEVTTDEVERLVDEGMMIVRSALRMSAKNRLIMQVLGAGEAFDEDALVDAVRTDARALAEEKSEEAERLEVVATKAAKKPGRATFHDDYRRQDVRALTLRERVGRETARRLHELGDDDAALLDLIHSARESALDDVIQARLSAVMPYRRDPLYRRERSERMRALADDLAVLHRRQKARLGDRIS